MKWICRSLVLAVFLMTPLLLAARQSQDDAPTASTIESAQELLEAMARTYQNAPAFTDTMTISLPTRTGPQLVTFDLLAGANGNAQLTALEHNFLVVDGQLYLSRESRPSKVVPLPLAGGRFLTLEPIETLRLPQLALRYGKSSADYLKGLGMGLVQNLQLTGRESVQINGATLEALLLKNDEATVRVLVDPQTNLIKSVKVSGRHTPLEFQMNPKVLAKAPREIVYDPKVHREVATLKQLALAVGDEAPDFTLTTLDDQEVTLSELCGSVVVLDFWATWCPPCRRGLPKLQEFANWVEQEGLDVKVFAVDTWERVKGNDQKRQKVQQYWQSQGFTMPVLMDYDDGVVTAFEARSIPHTVIIRPDGTLFKVHIGLNPNMVQALKQDTVEALAEAQ